MGGPATARVRVSEPEDPKALLAVAVEAATEAGTLLAGRARRGAEQQVSAKTTPTDLVSEADLVSERTIRELLAERRPHDGFVGEEGDHVEGTSGLSWVVDPLDGTINFLYSIPVWSVSVAVRDAAGTIAGAVYDPSRDELFTATRDGPAMLVGRERTVQLAGPGEGHGYGGAGEPGAAGGAAGGVASGARGAAGGAGERSLPPRAPWRGGLSTAMVATGLAYDADIRGAQGRVLAQLIPLVRDIRRLGSAALDLAWTAAGRFDAFFERSVKQWDIAAGALACERAGLRVLELPPRDELPWGILAAPAELAEELFAVVGEAEGAVE